jgi:hypothetical protein
LDGVFRGLRLGGESLPLPATRKGGFTSPLLRESPQRPYLRTNKTKKIIVR